MTTVARMTMLHLRTVAPYRIPGLLVFGVIVIIDSRNPVVLVPALALVLAPLLAVQPFMVADKADLQTLYAVLPLPRRAVLLGHYAWALITFLAVVITGTALAAPLAWAQSMPFDGRSLTTLLTVCWALFAVNISIQLPLLVRFGYTRISVLATTLPLVLVMLAIIRLHLDVESMQGWLPLIWTAGVVVIATSAALQSRTPARGQALVTGAEPDAHTSSLQHRHIGMGMNATKSSGHSRWWALPWPVWLVAGLMVAVLLSLSGAYGFHGDEMYFVVAGRHPAFGYVDQPPLTPLLSAASVAVFGVSPTAVRILPALEMALVVIIVGLTARDLGGSRRAQVLAAVTTGVSGYLAAGHLDTTTELDLLLWAAVLWLLVRLLAGADRRLWVAVGTGGGIGLENKDTLLFLAAGLTLGLVVCRRWEVVRSPWTWAAMLIAAVLWAPNLWWQASNGWPQLTMASQISGYAATNRAQVLPLLWLFTGPLLFPVCIAGLVWVLGSRAAAPWRPLGVAALAAMALDLLTGGKAYYMIGSVSLFMAAGGIVMDRWLARGHRRLKVAMFAAAAVASGALIAELTLPVLPVADYARTTLPAAVPDVANQIGWPQFVATVEQVVADLPPAQRAHAVILANDYSEASPLILLGKGLPPVYSGHNSYWTWGPPPAERTVVVHIGGWRPTNRGEYFTGCRDVAHIDNQLGIDNGEQGQPISVCTGIRAPWTTIWPALRTVS